MKLVKKIMAITVAVLLALALTACHPKNETALKVGDFEFTSGYYMCAMIFTDMEARSLVDEQLAEEEEETTDVDYIKQKVEDKDFSAWVKENTLESIKLIAAAKAKCKEAELEIDEDTKANAEYMALYYWDTYGYSYLFEPNGVSEETFKQYMIDTQYADMYFEHLYGKDGEKAISADDVKNTLSSKYALANMLEVDFAEMSETDITAAKEQFTGFEAALKDGNKTFEQVYHEYTGEEHAEEEETEETTEETEEILEPLDSHATLIGNEDTNYTSDYFDDISALKTGEVKLITLEEEAGLLLVVKQNVLDDPYYVENLDFEARDLIAGDDYDTDMQKYADGLEFKENSYATDRFKVKNIEYPETTA